ncbi:wax ester/triacylglycerol synthase family O-acyltransferase [Aldersonia sp. NBC_00410]|uniref:WS/DGAT/MGAT family O-acyltransferase n=1 Tax=Aldersonia sp. NBC_00410 TaxID=2975954 RepID=UPI002256DF0C|nr:wax ester/triacylglycerol synthase family O-acyltransferase [Aldersonia sp. NBC_00410]MCX5042995.1 wax ester/triacylglycerol synthase family O-acyltransferase [Aldersonia sp. NBC_00410]
MGFLAPIDSVFLLGESREHPMHVGGMHLYVPPEGAGPDYAREMYESFIAQHEMHPLYRNRPVNPVGTLGNIRMVQDQDVDLEYHVRLSALPRPGRVRELLALVSRIHGTLLDRHRPLWEMHVIEGLEDNRLAIYHKIHHSLLDGITALKMLERTLSTDPDARDCPAPWSPHEKRPRTNSRSGPNPLALLRSGADLIGDVAGLAPTAVRLANQALRGSDVLGPMQAPRSMFNVPIGGARRFAAQTWPMDRLSSVAKATGTKLNDVVLAMCAGALREYLLEQSALPDDPLITAVPVSLRAPGDQGGGNAVSIILCNLATDQADPVRRLETIAHSMRQSKEFMRSVTPLQAMAIGAVNMSSIALNQIPGYARFAQPSFNILISNVPGPTEDLFYNGARLDGLYPLSIVLDGFALNITLTSRAGYLDFGLTGDRHSVPHLQRLLTHLEDSLTDLEKATA